MHEEIVEIGVKWGGGVDVQVRYDSFLKEDAGAGGRAQIGDGGEGVGVA